MGFLRPKTIVMPQAAQRPVAASQVKTPPATIEDTYAKKPDDTIIVKDAEGNETGEVTTAKKEAEKKIRKKKTGMTPTILTGPQGVEEDADIFKKSLLG
tara:strand:+ start:5125 stop:5421 length:297 start_codon:yes stop_codon:yes gene_type:complete